MLAKSYASYENALAMPTKQTISKKPSDAGLLPKAPTSMPAMASDPFADNTAYKKQIHAEIVDALNPVQKEAVEHDTGPILIVAGAGSGKTRVITHRIAYLIRVCGVRPWNIASVTFTNKAAEEMRLRLANLIGDQAQNVFVRTFHSLGLYILTRHPEAVGLKSGFTIVDQSGQKSMLKLILKEDGWGKDFMEPQTLANYINQARDALKNPQELANSGESSSEEIAQIYKSYIKRLRQNNSVDFGDLLYESVRLLRRDKLLRKKYQNLWRYFLIDEYQDTNHLQYWMGCLIAKEHSNIMVVGDDDQSIYSWRGADIQNILSFEKDYPNAKVLRLEENYRSTPQILKAASSLIANNTSRRVKTLFTQSKSDIPVSLEACYDESDEARHIIEKVQAQHSQGIPLRDMAIIYRTNAQSRVLERILREQRLNYVLVGDIRFYERKEIKDILAYLNVLANPTDNLSLERIINVPVRGIGQTSVERLQAFASSKEISLLEALASADQVPQLRSYPKMQKLHTLFQKWQEELSEGVPPSLIAKQVLEGSGYLKALEEEDSHEAQNRIANLYELIASLKEYEQECTNNVTNVYEQTAFDPLELSENTSDELKQADKEPSLSNFLQTISLYTSAKGEQNKLGDDALYLMTLHNAKGLEYESVFLCGLEEAYLPHSFSVAEDNIEEERRLFYVGITRARRYLQISYANQRWLFGSLQGRDPSRFLREIDSDVF